MAEKERLAGIPLFAGLDTAVLAGLAQGLEVRPFADGDTICREGEKGDTLFIVDQGQVVVSKVIDWQDMREKTLATLPKGAFFGEMALLDDVPRSATVRASGACSLLCMSRANFLQILQKSSLVAAKLLFGIIKTVNYRLRQTSTELVTLYDTGKIVGGVRDLPTLTAKIMERLTETLQAPKGAFILENPYSAALEVKELVGYPATLDPTTLVLDREAPGLLRALFDERKPLLVPRIAATGWQTCGLEEDPLIATPLITNDRVIGGIVLTGRTEGFSQDNLNLLSGVAGQVATAVENARMREEEDAKELHRRVYVTY